MNRTSSTTVFFFLFSALLLAETASALPRSFPRCSSELQSSPKSVAKIKSGQQNPLYKKKNVRNRRDNVYDVKAVDYGAILKYSVALCIQVTFSFGFWRIVDWTKKTFSDPLRSLFWAKFVLVYFLNLQVGRFNILSTISKDVAGDISPDRKRPLWTPPGWVFALMWPFFVFGIRAYAMVVVADKVGGFGNPLTLSMMFHFGIGGLWSHVNRIEQQLGVSMVLLYALFGSKAVAAYLAYRIDPNAGIALACTLTWLLAAAALGTATWRLNPDRSTGRPQSLVPRKS